MKTSRLTIIAVIALASSFADLRADEAAILQVTRDACKAFVDRDTRRLREVLTEDFTLTDASGTVTTRADEIANAETGAVKYEVFENHDMKVRVYGDSAVVTGRTTVKGNAGSRRAEFNSTAPSSAEAIAGASTPAHIEGAAPLSARRVETD